MGTETNMVEYEQTEAETDLEAQTTAKKEREAKPEERGEIRFFGVRVLVADLVPSCEKIDRMFGSGGEAIVHYMWFASGQSLFDKIIISNPGKTPEELLKSLVNAQPSAGWGKVFMRIVQADPPLVVIVVKNPPVKTLKGSQKHLIGSFWAGVLSKYFNRQLTCKNFVYEADKDEFSCTVTI